MKLLLVFSTFLFVLFQNASASEMMEYSVMPGDSVELYLGKWPNYRRSTTSSSINHVFRVCNGKNVKTCGYWENVKTKKKVANAAKTSRKNGEYLVLKNVTLKDSGRYWSKDSYLSLNVMAPPPRPPGKK